MTTQIFTFELYWYDLMTGFSAWPTNININKLSLHFLYEEPIVEVVFGALVNSVDSVMHVSDGLGCICKQDVWNWNFTFHNHENTLIQVI